MNVLIAAVSSTSKLSGVQRHAFNAVRCLLKQQDIGRVHLVVAPWQREMVDSFAPVDGDRVIVHIPEIPQNVLDRNAWYYWHLPALAAQVKADVVHLSFPAPVNGRAFHCPVVVTLHDLYPYEIPENFHYPRVLFNQMLLSMCLRNVDAIACVSETTSVRVQQYFPDIPWPKIECIYNCVEPGTLCALDAPIREWRGEPFLLCVAQHRRNKNIPFLVNVFSDLLKRKAIDPKTLLVIVGIAGPETQRIQRRIERLGLAAQVVLLEGISDPELQWCYGRCEALVAPSLTEGFGLPVAEAMLVGCRIACSEIRAFVELDDMTEGLCHFFSLDHDPERAFADAITRCLSTERRSAAKLPALRSAVVGQQYLQLYQALVAAQISEQRVHAMPRLQSAVVERHSL